MREFFQKKKQTAGERTTRRISIKCFSILLSRQSFKTLLNSDWLQDGQKIQPLSLILFSLQNKILSCAIDWKLPLIATAELVHLQSKADELPYHVLLKPLLRARKECSFPKSEFLPALEVALCISNHKPALVNPNCSLRKLIFTHL